MRVRLGQEFIQCMLSLPPPGAAPLMACMSCAPVISQMRGRCYLRHRSSEVVTECGPNNALVAADEVDFCHHRLTLEPPLACTKQDRRLVETQRLNQVASAVEW